jgi:hypothetical protein
MRRFVYAFTISALALSTAMMATTRTNKTFLAPRDHASNIAMEFSTWQKQINKIDDKKFGGFFQATPFCQASTNKMNMGKYFGIENQNASNRLDNYILISNSANDKHQEGHRILLDGGTTTADTTLSTQIDFRPFRGSYGIRLDYHQKLDNFLEGLYLRVNAPIVCVKTSLGYTYSGQSQQLKTATGFDGGAKTVEEYLKGNVSNTATSYKQAALSYAKIHNGQEATNIADINLMFGYNFLYSEKRHISLNASFIIPTGNAADGEFRFAPIVGNGGHFAVGIGGDAFFEFWKDGKKSMDVSFVANYKHLFKATDKRTLDFKYANTEELSTLANTRVMWGPYMLGGTSGATEATPLANFLTQDVNVTPGSQIDMLISLGFNYDKWRFDAGYEFFAKEAESVKVKSWTDDTIGIAATSWDTQYAFMTDSTHSTIYMGTDGAYGNYALYTIDSGDLLPSSAASPSQATHKIFASAGYAFSDWEYPLMAGLGGSYDFASGNAALEEWAVWFKLGLSF